MYNFSYLDVLQAFDSEITSLYFLEDKRQLISTSKGKSIKIWTLPKEWRDGKLVADLAKKANAKYIKNVKERVKENLAKAQEDSDDDDLAGWHLD